MGAEKKTKHEDWSWMNQAAWRRWGFIAILAAAVMAVYAVAGSVLHDTAIHLARSVADPTEEAPVPKHGLIFVGFYWCCFAFTILVALYCAMLDLRFIRLQYSVSKRALVHENFRDEAVQDAFTSDSKKQDR